MERGLIHIYCGDGKGKTSSAVGLAVRAAGCKKKVLFARFLKNENSGELNILDSISDIEVLHLEKSFIFYHKYTLCDNILCYTKLNRYTPYIKITFPYLYYRNCLYECNIKNYD